jgi:serine/threonine-protein kinase ATR
MTQRFFLFVISLIFSVSLNAQQWDADAGLILPYPAKITVSSGQNKQYITDNNPHTYWQSDNPLPNRYISRKDLNYFLHKHHFSTSPELSSATPAFDGNTNTHQEIQSGRLSIDLHPATSLLLLSLKADVKDTLFLFLETTNHKTIRFKYSPAHNFQIVNFNILSKGEITNILLESRKPFQLYELAALHKKPTEHVLFDFGQTRNIGWISSRQLNSSSVTQIEVLASNDKQHWHPVISLNPKAIPFLYSPLTHPVAARYLKIVFFLPVRNYQKAALWEFAVYDKNGPWGAKPAAKPSQNTFAQAFGINTFWGWGYSVYSDLLHPGTGPEKFKAIAKNLRSYEPLDWDMVRPQQIPDFTKMAAGGGTPAKKWLNWDREYKTWLESGFHIDISLAFTQKSFSDSLWKNTYREAFAFGKAYASHFCVKKHLVSMIEIGNEPWSYNSNTYRQILDGMDAGIKSVSKVPVLPCAVQAYDPTKDDNDYVAKYMDASAKNVGGLNAHIYSYVFQENGKRTAVNPEDPRSEVWSMANLLRFRDKNLPGKPVYVTEFGFDSNGGGESCTHSECVTEKEQAIYGVRMSMILWRLGARQFYWYYFANVAYKSFLHNRSGLSASYNTGFREKLSFKTFALLQQQIGNFHFVKIIRENNNVYAYLLENYKTGNNIIIAWRPTVSNHFKQLQEQFAVPGKVSKVISILTGQTISFKEKNNLLQMKLSGVPVLIHFRN